MSNSTEPVRTRSDRWDLEADVVVAGYGYAGGVTAIAAHDAGASVILIEKGPHFGGNSIVSGGGIVFADDAEKAFQYLHATSGGRTPDDLLRAFAQGLTELEAFFKELAERAGVRLQYSSRENGATYPFPGGETLHNVKIAEIPGFSGFPWATGLRAGGRLFKVLSDNVAQRAIDVRYNTPARQLVTNDAGAVVGLIAEHEGRELRIRARGGVVLATGGFENDPEMRRQFFEAQPVFPVCSLTNTGDGIRMAQKVGAALWHMWHFHGGYGFVVPDLPFALRHSFRGPRKDDAVMPWIVVDRSGNRFMNEYPPAVQDTGARAFEVFDADVQAFTRIPSWLIYDEEGRKLGPIADVIINDEGYKFSWSSDNLAEVEKGWILQEDTIEALAERMGVDPAALRATVDRWNQHYDNGQDPDFRRVPTTMAPIRTAPFYAIQVWPICSNTQGGPMHDAQQRVLDAFGQPIPGLYAVGELGSLFGHLYLEAGNVAECFVGGRIAGRNAAAAAKLAEASIDNRVASR